MFESFLSKAIVIGLSCKLHSRSPHHRQGKVLRTITAQR